MHVVVLKIAFPGKIRFPGGLEPGIEEKIRFLREWGRSVEFAGAARDSKQVFGSHGRLHFIFEKGSPISNKMF